MSAVAIPANATEALGALGPVPKAASVPKAVVPQAVAVPQAPVTLQGAGAVTAHGELRHGIVTLPRMVWARDLNRASQQPRAAAARTHDHSSTTRLASSTRRSVDRATPARRTTERASRTSTRPKATAAPKRSTSTPSSSRIVDIAKRYIGVPYVYGGSTPSGWDCSGFTSYVYRKAGIELPRSARAQQAAATRISNPRPGDLVFYGYPARHVMIYVGNGLVIDSAKPGTTVSIHKMWGTQINYGRFS